VTTQLAFDFSAPVAAPPHRFVDTARRLRGRVAQLSGDAAESIVARHYTRRGFEVAHRRWRSAAGEIDLVLKDGDALIFVEVKKSRSFARAAERVSVAQMRRIYASAEYYLADTPRGQLTDVRFDVALVNGVGDVRIVENAFGQG